MSDTRQLGLHITHTGKAGIFLMTPAGPVPVLVFDDIETFERFLTIQNVVWPQVKAEAEAAGMIPSEPKAAEVGCAIEEGGMAYLSMVYGDHANKYGVINIGPTYPEWLDALLMKLAEPGVAARVLWGFRALRYAGQHNEALAEEAALFLKEHQEGNRD